MFFTAAALLVPFAAVAVVAQETGYKPDPAFQSCPIPDPTEEAEPIQGQVWAPDMTNNQVSDDKVFFLDPGLGACGFNYTDTTPGVCLTPGWVNSRKDENGCNKLVELTLESTGVTTYGRVVDACGTDKNSTFGCNDVYVTKVLFTTLANGNATMLNAGNLMSNVSWRFLGEDKMDEVNSTTPLDVSPLTKTIEETSYHKSEEFNYKSDESFEKKVTKFGDSGDKVNGLLGDAKPLRRRSFHA